jgi:long-chain acyl-CoA synthetase
MLRTRLFADPEGAFVHDAILASCSKQGERIAIVDTSVPGAPLRLSYARYGELVQTVARNLIGRGVRPGDRIALFLSNSWEFCVAYHAATLAGAVPTPMNPNYRDREAHFQIEDSGASVLITNGPAIAGVDLARLPALRHVFTIRDHVASTTPFADLLKPSATPLAASLGDSRQILAALPYSSGTTGLPKGVMLSHFNLVSNIYQFLIPGEVATFRDSEVVCCALPLFHIYGLNVVLNCVLAAGGTLVLMPRFDAAAMCRLISEEGITMVPLVPPAMNALCNATEQGLFPREHHIRRVKSGAAPLAPELARKFIELTGIPIVQGYGMTEASPVTHTGFLEPEWYKPDSIGHPLALTDCRIVREDGSDAAANEPGELVMRGPQFMLGYWNSPEATREVLRDGWYWSGDVATRDERGFFAIVDRRKEMLKYNGFAIAPAEVEAVLLEHPAVRDCGVVGRPDQEAGEVPTAFVVLREGNAPSGKLETELAGYVADRLIKYKQPRAFHFVSAIPRNPSGKILRRELRAQL